MFISPQNASPALQLTPKLSAFIHPFGAIGRTSTPSTSFKTGINTMSAVPPKTMLGQIIAGDPQQNKPALFNRIAPLQAHQPDFESDFYLNADGESAETGIPDDQDEKIDSEKLAKLITGADHHKTALKMKAVGDKAHFFLRLGVDPNVDCSTKGGAAADACNVSQDAAEVAWDIYHHFHINEIKSLQTMDPLAVGQTLTKALVQMDVDSAKKAQASFLFNIFADKLRMIREIDLKPYQEKQKLDATNNFQNSQSHRLPMTVGDLGEVLEMKSKLDEILSDFDLELPRQPVSGGGAIPTVEMKGGDGTPSVNFDDVAGIDEAKAELMEIVDYLKNPAKYEKMGAKIPKGVLLEGGPGVGKTLMAQAIAGEAGVPFFSASGSQFVEEYVGVGAKRVRDLFKKAERAAPCIVFIDEIDAIGRARSTRNDGGGSQEHENTLNQLLTEMDGYQKKAGVIVIGATNRADLLDGALKRPGRFDRNIEVPLPTVVGREAILKVHSRNVPMAEDIDFDVIARLTIGFSGADLANLVNEAALSAIRGGREEVTVLDFENARDKIVMGLAMPSIKMTEKDRLMTAYHEAAHAIVSHALDGGREVFKVTIMPRGGSLGSTHYIPEDDSSSVTYRQLYSAISSLLAGRMAEEIVFGEKDVTTGASNDLARASGLARRMVAEWGYSPVLGQFSTQYQGQVAPTSGFIAQIVDQEVARILQEAGNTTRSVLEEYRDKMDGMAQLLMDKETINAQEVKDLLGPSGTHEV